MYKCKCGKEINLTDEQWNDIIEQHDNHKQAICGCGETLNVITCTDWDGTWFVCSLYFESDHKEILDEE